MEKFKKIYRKLFEKSVNFIDIMKDIINGLEKPKNIKFIRNLKHTTEEYIMGIIEVLSNNISWRKYNGKIDGRVLNNKHNHYCKIGVYDELYKRLLDDYKRNNDKHQKYLSLDSSFVCNKHGCENIGRNIYYRNKRGSKITALVDNKGIPLEIELSKGNIHDAKIAPLIIGKLGTNKKGSTKYILADKGYDSIKIIEQIEEKNYKAIIARRKIKNRKRSLKKCD